ncbi:MAG: 2-hydroxyacyl-CoA dehydratase subunit D, partial [bacterium]
RGIGFLLERPGLFALLKPYLWWIKWKNPTPTLAQFSYRVTLENILTLYGRKKPVVWASLFFPAEFVHAMGGAPFYPEITAGLLSALGAGTIPLAKGEAHWFSPDLCSYHRLSVGASILRFFPRPDFLCATSSICRGTVPFFETLAELFRVPLYLVDVPQEYSWESSRYVARQLEAVAQAISRSQKITWDFERPFLLAQETVATIQEIETLRKKKEVMLLPPTKNLDYFPYYYQFMGSETSLSFFQKLREALRTTPPKTLPHRLLWLHLKPFYSNFLSALLAEFGLGVAFEEFASVYEGELDSRQPFESLAEKIIVTSYGFMDGQARLERILRWIQEYTIEGVIQFNQWGCRQSQGMNALLRKYLRQKG